MTIATARVYKETPQGVELGHLVPVIIPTGLESWQGATELVIFYQGGNTYVEHSGECFNCEGMFTEELITPLEALADYLAAVAQEDSDTPLVEIQAPIQAWLAAHPR